MNISFLRNAQAEEKEEMSYFCMHAPAADGHAAAQRPGAGSGAPAAAAPPAPRPEPTPQLQRPQKLQGVLGPTQHPPAKARAAPKHGASSCPEMLPVPPKPCGEGKG